MNKLEEGAKAPGFVASSTKGSISFDTIQNKYIVLYFYPKDMTPGCTIQAEDFSALYDEFKKFDTLILGVSKDSLESHHEFCNAKNIPYPLLFDPNASICKSYGVMKEKSMFGKKYTGIERTTFLINSQRSVIAIWENVKPKNHAKEVLERISQISAS